MEKTNWKYQFNRSAIGDTGDYDSWVTFTNGKNSFHSSGDEIDEEDAQRFCDLLDLMPDLCDSSKDNTDFILRHELEVTKAERDRYKALSEDTGAIRFSQLTKEVEYLRALHEAAEDVILDTGDDENYIDIQTICRMNEYDNQLSLLKQYVIFPKSTEAYNKWQELKNRKP